MKKSVAKPHTKTKKITVHPKHAKPYRKRHYGLLGISLIAVVVLFTLAIQFRYKADSGLRSARNFISDSLNFDRTNQQAVHSTYGFNFSYDPAQFYASGVDASTGTLYIGKDLQTARSYQTLRLSSTSVDATDSQSALTMDYVVSMTGQNISQLENIEKQLVANKQNTESTLTKGTSEKVTIGGKPFLKTQWKQQPKGELAARFTSEFTTYITVLDGKPLIIKANAGITGSSATNFDDIVNSLTFGQSAQLPVQQTTEVAAKVEKSRSLLDSLMFTQTAQAASQTKSAEQTSALYAPAVVKVFNVYCMDIQIENKPYINDACSGVTGSGFFISSNGYIATNGHVAVATPKDIVIYDALVYLSRGNLTYFNKVAELANLKESDLAAAGKDDRKALDIAVDKFYQIPDSKFTAVNSVSNLLVDLNDKQPDTAELVDMTKNRDEYPGDDNIKRATVVAADYRMIDGITTFHQSDVAIIKIDGENYPVAQLGDLSEAGQGTDLAILGYPSNASENGLTEATQSKVTLTTGKVSAIKNATGSSSKLIETDTTIGHGNSGGPAFSENGTVVGIATYTADGSGKGDGTFNYIRSIQDIKDLAAKNNIDLGTNNPTQTEWQKAINSFYNARYSKALKNFEKVKELYPQHPTVGDFIANSQQKIANGEDVKDFPIAVVIGGIIIALAGVGVAAFLIIRHHGKHQLYKVASGQAVAAPAGFGQITGSVNIPGIPTPGAAATPEAPAPVSPVDPPQPPEQPPQPPVAG